MNLLALLVFILLPTLQEPFSQFSYCRDTARGLYESQCVNFKADGTGELTFKRRGSEAVHLSLKLSPAGHTRFLAVLAATNHLSGAANWESKRKVADLGRKRLVLEMTDGKREADFNYSDLKEVNALATFFDGVLNQGTIMFDMETALRFERLSVPERLDSIESELKANRIADPPGLIPMLEKIEQDSRVMDYARGHAQQMKQRIAAGK
jgi:hypothetical protein